MLLTGIPYLEKHLFPQTFNIYIFLKTISSSNNHIIVTVDEITTTN